MTYDPSPSVYGALMMAANQLQLSKHVDYSHNPIYTHMRLTTYLPIPVPTTRLPTLTTYLPTYLSISFYHDPIPTYLACSWLVGRLSGRGVRVVAVGESNMAPTSPTLHLNTRACASCCSMMS